MIDKIQTTLQEHFGFSQMRPGQQQVIEHLLDGHSAAAIFPTGGGKSLCYQLPALLLPGVTLVVSPLIALMKDQIDALTKRDIHARRLDSSLGVEDYREVMGRIRCYYPTEATVVTVPTPRTGGPHDRQDPHNPTRAFRFHPDAPRSATGD